MEKNNKNKSNKNIIQFSESIQWRRFDLKIWTHVQAREKCVTVLMWQWCPHTSKHTKIVQLYEFVCICRRQATHPQKTKLQDKEVRTWKCSFKFGSFFVPSSYYHRPTNDTIKLHRCTRHFLSLYFQIKLRQFQDLYYPKCNTCVFNSIARIHHMHGSHIWTNISNKAFMRI